jgi:hypothetical protein
MENRVRAYWTSDRSLNVLLWLLCITIFGVIPTLALGPLPGWEHETLTAFFSLVMISVVLSAWTEKRSRRLILAAAMLPLLLLWLELFYKAPLFTMISGGIRLGMVAVFAAVLLGRVLAEGPVTSERLKGAIAVYLLVGVIWEEAYRVVSIAAPGALSVGAHDVNSLKYTAELLYFSFSTLTTNGYGDIVPVNPIARALANAEAITGQMYVVLLIGRLLSMHLAEQGQAAAKRRAEREG